MKKILGFGMIILSLIGINTNIARASHLMGSEITWTYVGQDSILVKLVVYRDCNGITLSTTPINFLNDSSGATITSTSIAVGTPVDITPICQSSCTRCTSVSCSFPYGIHKYTMQSIVYIGNASGCCKIRITWSQNARSSAITTSSGAGTADLYIEEKLNRCLAQPDNSPSFKNNTQMILCLILAPQILIQTVAVN